MVHSPPPVIDLAGVTLAYDAPGGRVEALRGVDLRAGRGESVAVIGPSGAGKSSLLMVTGGLEKASGGQVTVDGHDLSTMSEDALALWRRGRVGVVFQSFRLIATLSAEENVALPLELAGDPDARIKAAEALALVGLERRRRHRPDELSGGEQQRVALARAAAMRPTLLLADEPTGNLDQATGALVMDMLFDLQRLHSATLLLITHDPALAQRCDRVEVLRDGRLTPQAVAA